MSNHPGVYKRGPIWWIRYDGPPHADGTRNEIRESCKGLNCKQAQALREERLRAIRRGEFVGQTTETLRAFSERWLSGVSPNLAVTTRQVYRDLLRVHLLPALGDYKLTQLTPSRLVAHFADLAAQRAPKTVRNVYNLLHRLLNDAVRWGVLYRNPADSIDAPRVPHTETDAGDPAELRAILYALRDRVWYLPTLIAMTTGLRRGEVLGLQWGDYQNAQKVFTVRRSLVRVRDSEVHVKAPKSGKARVVAISGTLARILSRHRSRCAHTAPTDWLCQNPDGSHLAPNGLSLAFRRAAQKLGFQVHFHSIRHTQATQLLMAGVPVKAVSERLGHSTAQITQDIYGHLLPHIQEQAAALAEAHILKPMRTIRAHQQEKDGSEKPS